MTAPSGEGVERAPRSMSESQARVQWAKWQAEYRRRSDQVDDYSRDLSCKYGDAFYARPAERRKLESLRDCRDRVSDKIYTWLESASARRWGSGVPFWWICTALTFDDATRPANQPLSVVPPLAYGATRHME